MKLLFFLVVCSASSFSWGSPDEWDSFRAWKRKPNAIRSRYDLPKIRPKYKDECDIYREPYREKKLVKIDAAPTITEVAGKSIAITGNSKIQGDVKITGKVFIDHVETKSGVEITNTNVRFTKLFPSNSSGSNTITLKYSTCPDFSELNINGNQFGDWNLIEGDVRIDSCGLIEVSHLKGDIRINGIVDIGYSNFIADEDGTAPFMTLNGDKGKGLDFGSVTICNAPTLKGELGFYIGEMKDYGSYNGDPVLSYTKNTEAGKPSIGIGPFLGDNEFKGHFGIYTRIKNSKIDGQYFCNQNNFCKSIYLDTLSTVGERVEIKGHVDMVNSTLGAETILDGQHGPPGYQGLPGIALYDGASFVGVGKKITGNVWITSSSVTGTDLTGRMDLADNFALWIEQGSVINNCPSISGSVRIISSIVNGTSIYGINAGLTSAILNGGSVSLIEGGHICGPWPAGYVFNKPPDEENYCMKSER